MKPLELRNDAINQLLLPKGPSGQRFEFIACIETEKLDL